VSRRKKKKGGGVARGVAHFSDVLGTASLNNSKITLQVCVRMKDSKKFDKVERANLPTGELSTEKSMKTRG
jgi:hypothetical protein